MCAQVGQPFPVTVLFKPRAHMLQQCAKFVPPSRGVGD